MGNSIVTVIARKKMVRARAGVSPLPIITGMAFGDGAQVGKDVLAPQPEDITLKNELLRKAVDQYEEISDTCYRYVCTLAKGDLVGKSINEIALYDADGDLVAIKSFLNKGKDDDMEMILEIDDKF